MPVLPVEDRSDLIAVEAISGEVPALQIDWTDSRGRLPWDPDYANAPGSQGDSASKRPRKGLGATARSFRRQFAVLPN
ncbi:MAG: hypothetical protein QOE09_3454 [Ilumatobacteraceae bacterium]|jgi:hypothetical protein